MRQAVMRHQRRNVRELRLVGAQKLLARRHVEEQVAHRDGGAPRQRRLLAGWTLTSPPMPKFFQSIASPPKPRKKPLRLGVPAHVPPVAVGEPTGVHWPFVPGRVLSMPLELALSCAVPKPIMKSTELCALANGAHSNRRERMGRYRQIRFTSEVLL